jgi:hypothetical protein
VKVLHPSVRDASTTGRHEGGLHAPGHGNQLLCGLCSYNLRLYRKYRCIALILVFAASVAKSSVWHRTAKFFDCWQSLRTYCEQACLRSHLSALEASSLAYGSWLECLGAVDIAHEQRRVCSGCWSAHLQLSDRYRCFCTEHWKA